MLFYPLSILLSAFLIFQIQPMIARTILPWLGGVPAVWSTVQMYFQVLLTGGYAYAAWLAKTGKRREKFHIGMICVSLLVMVVFLALGWKSPILPNAAWKPAPGKFTCLGDCQAPNYNGWVALLHPFLQQPLGSSLVSSSVSGKISLPIICDFKYWFSSRPDNLPNGPGTCTDPGLAGTNLGYSPICFMLGLPGMG